MQIKQDEKFYEAIKEGVIEAILTMTESGDGVGFKRAFGPLRTDQFMEAIRQGTQDAIWQIATNETHAPGTAFYDSVIKGIKDAHE